MFGPWLTALLTTIPITKQQHEARQFEVNLKPTIIPSLGVALKPRGFLASGGDPIFASIFLDIPMPLFGQRRCKTSNLGNTKADFTNCKANMKLVARVKAKFPELVDDSGRVNEKNRAKVLECLTEAIQNEEVTTTHMQIEDDTTISLCVNSKKELTKFNRMFSPNSKPKDYPNWEHMWPHRGKAFSMYWKKILNTAQLAEQLVQRATDKRN
jgi:hypothetical protein